MRTRATAFVALLALAGCGADPVWAPDAAVARARYVHDAPPSITVYTVISNRDNSGAHSALLINGSERVMFDPAGTWYHPAVPERNDVHFGMTPRMVDFYIDYHARETFRVIEQTVPVTPEQAELALLRAKDYGAVPKAFCARSTSSILQGVPGFEGVRSSFFPGSVMASVARVTGVEGRVIYDGDAPNNHGVLMTQQNVILEE